MKKKWMFITIVLLVISNTASAADWGYYWISTKYFFSSKASYKAIEDLEVIDDLSNCTDKTKVTYQLPVNAQFQIPRSDKSHITNDHWIVGVDWPNSLQGSNSTTSTGGLYKFCLESKGKNQEHRYKRIGGMTTGVLIVPFKWREEGNVFSGEATVGPYFGFKNQVFTLAVSAGLSQVAVKTPAGEDTNYETGFTSALGFIFDITDSYDIALVAGKDHLFGSAADDFEHQNDWWYSFGIGYKFTD